MTDAFWEQRRTLLWDKSGPNLVIYSEPSYQRSCGPSPNPTRQSRRSGRSTNEELGEERRPRAAGTVTRRLAARLTTCALEQFHNRWRRHRLFQRPPTEKGGGRQRCIQLLLYQVILALTVWDWGREQCDATAAASMEREREGL